MAMFVQMDMRTQQWSRPEESNMLAVRLTHPGYRVSEDVQNWSADTRHRWLLLIFKFLVFHFRSHDWVQEIVRRVTEISSRGPVVSFHFARPIVRSVFWFISELIRLFVHRRSMSTDYNQFELETINRGLPWLIHTTIFFLIPLSLEYTNFEFEVTFEYLLSAV